MLILARESRGLTQKELSYKLDIGQGTLSKIEQGLQGVSDEILTKLSIVLEYPENFFANNYNIYSPNMVYFRKRVTLPKKILSKSEARMNIIRIAVEILLNNVELPEYEMVEWKVGENGTPAEAAMYLRNRWKLPKGRVESIVELLESRGIIIILLDFESKKIDGMSMMTENGHPIIYINSRMPSDRQRLSIAHELGHLIMHFSDMPSIERDIENEAFSFAGEFLIPEVEYTQRYEYLNMPILANQKRYWKVSMSSLIYRAKELKLVSENQARYLWAQLGALGYKTAEPPELDIDFEEPTLTKQIVNTYIEDLGYNAQELLSITHLFKRDFDQFLLPNRSNKLRLLT